MTNSQLKALEELIEINSHTDNKDGVNKVGKLVMGMLEGVSLEWEITPSKRDDRGDYYFAKSKNWDDSKPVVLFCGHLDTVFKENWNHETSKEKFRGPGTLDMKAGVLAMIEITKRLEKEKKLTNLMLLFTPDEEDGMHHIEKQKEYYNMADYAFIFEEGTWTHVDPDPKSRALVVSRKALSFFQITVTGPGGHNASHKLSEQRHSAIEELARITTDLHTLCDYEAGTLVNVGIFNGGTAPNAIAEEATARVDIRYGNANEVNRIKTSLEKVMKSQDKEITIECKETLFYPSWDYNTSSNSFANEIITIAKDLGLEMQIQHRSAGSEANWIAYHAKGCTVFDGFGVVGTGDHSKREFFFKKSFDDSCELGYRSYLKAIDHI